VLAASAESLLALPGFDQDTVDAVVSAARVEQAAQQSRASSEPVSEETAEPSEAPASEETH
jgi:hypothetical protein